METSRVDVNLRIKETIRLLIAAKAKIKINPYKIDVPKLFDSILLSPLRFQIFLFTLRKEDKQQYS
jgi:hypothetical protein